MTLEEALATIESLNARLERALADLDRAHRRIEELEAEFAKRSSRRRPAKKAEGGEAQPPSPPAKSVGPTSSGSRPEEPAPPAASALSPDLAKPAPQPHDPAPAAPSPDLVVDEPAAAPAAPEEPVDPVQRAFLARPIPEPPPGPIFGPPRAQRRPGRRPLPAHLPIEQLPDGVVSCCTNCGCDKLDRVDSFVEERLTIVTSHHRRRVQQRVTMRCRRCQRRTTSQAHPAPYKGSMVSCEWLAWLVCEKYDKGVPLDRIRRILLRQGINISLSALVGMIAQAAKLIAPIDKVHWDGLLASSHMSTDGTGLLVLVKGGPGTHHGYLEAYHRGSTVVFQYEPSKDGEVQATKLEKFKGNLQADAESRYNETFRNPDITESGCNAHPRRALRDAEVAQPALAVEAGHFIGQAYAAEAEARKLGLTGARLRDWRQKKVKPALDQFLQWARAVEPVLTPKDPLRAVLRYYNNHWPALTRFLDDPEVAIDNSSTERLFQPVAKLRHACLFAGSPAGAQRMACLLGLMATCRRLGVDPQRYLTWLFERRGTASAHYGLEPSQLTPAAWLAQQHQRSPERAAA